MPEHKLIATLRALHDGGVDFILVGGLAAVLNGAPVDTFEIDVLHSAAGGHLNLITRYGPRRFGNHRTRSRR
jgi:hypothetical protein